MSKWKCEICNSSFENFDARGFDNKIYCPLCYYKKLYKDTELEREILQKLLDIEKNKRKQFDKNNQLLHSIIKEVREYIDNEVIVEELNSSYTYITVKKEDILEILDKENKD